MKKLHYHPFPKRITFDTNPGVCNLACIMCDTHSVFSEKKGNKHKLPIMDFSLIQSIIDEGVARGLEEVIPSTMGEPLLFKHTESMFRLANMVGVRINLTTNGTFPRLGVQKWSELILPVTSDIKISLNGISESVNTKIMCGVDHQRQLENIRAFTEKRDLLKKKGKTQTTITLQVTLMESNLDQLPGIVQFAENIGIERIKAHHVWVTNSSMENENLRRSEQSIKRWNQMACQLRYLASNMRIRLENMDEVPSESSTFFQDHLVCPFLGREAWIASDGSFNVCCCPDNLRKDFGNFGNVKDSQSLLPLWSGEKYINFVKNWGGEHPNCQQCNMKRKREN